MCVSCHSTGNFHQSGRGSQIPNQAVPAQHNPGTFQDLLPTYPSNTDKTYLTSSTGCCSASQSPPPSAEIPHSNTENFPHTWSAAPSLHRERAVLQPSSQGPRPIYSCLFSTLWVHSLLFFSCLPQCSSLAYFTLFTYIVIHLSSTKNSDYLNKARKYRQITG